MTVRSTWDPARSAAACLTLTGATRNHDKVALLARLAGRWHTIRQIPVGVEVIEPEPDPDTGDSCRPDPLVTIARSKAISVSDALGGARTIASDGGLLIPSLGDAWQPARTRRFAGPTATNDDRSAALLALAAPLMGDQRRIGWREVVAIAEGGRVIATFAAEATPGWLIKQVRADPADEVQGFWVPRLWTDCRDGMTATPGAGTDHWDRLALLVGPYLDGLAAGEAR